MSEYKYKHSKLKIIGLIGLFATVILTPILVSIYDIDFETALVFPMTAFMFGILIMAGLLNEM